MTDSNDTTAKQKKKPTSTEKARAPWWVWPLVVAVGALALSIALAFDDVSLTPYQLDFLDAAAKILGALAVLFGAFRYFDERARQLAWDKTKFIVELFEDFDSAEDYQRARRLIDRAYATDEFAYLRRILGDPQDITDDEWRDRDAVDRFIDFFDRLYTHVYITRTLSADDVSSFSGYVVQIRDSEALSGFALDWGYEDVLEFAARFEENTEQRVALTERWRARLEHKP